VYDKVLFNVESLYTVRSEPGMFLSVRSIKYLLLLEISSREGHEIIILKVHLQII